MQEQSNYASELIQATKSSKSGTGSTIWSVKSSNSATGTQLPSSSDDVLIIYSNRRDKKFALHLHVDNNDFIFRPLGDLYIFHNQTKNLNQYESLCHHYLQR